MEEELATCIIDCDHDDMTCLGDCVREYDQNIENCPCKSGEKPRLEHGKIRF